MDAAEPDSAQAEHGSHLLMQVQRMRSTKEFTDVVLLTEGVSFHCHKVVLSAFSPYFQVKLVSSKSHVSEGCDDCHVCSGHVYMWAEGNPRS